MTKKAEAEKERTDAIERLRELFPPGSRVSTILRHVSRSGMLRCIDVLAVGEYQGKPEVFAVGWQAARAIGWRFDRNHGGVRVNGCGMDMGFHLVYSLSRTLYPNGFGCIGEHCPSNDHSNGDRDRAPHGLGHEHWHRDGGYALRHTWV